MASCGIYMHLCMSLPVFTNKCQESVTLPLFMCVCVCVCKCVCARERARGCAREEERKSTCDSALRFIARGSHSYLFVSVCASVWLNFCLSVCPCVCVCVYVSICVSVCASMWECAHVFVFAIWVTTDLYVRHDSFTCLTVLFHIHDYFVCVPRLFHTLHMTRLE